jgi:HlyD family secretion protein
MMQKIYNRFSFRNLAVLTVIVLAIAFAAGLIGANARNNAPSEPSYLNAKAEKLQQLVFASGTVAAKSDETLTSPVSGKIVEVNAKVGDYIEKDKVVFVIEYTNQFNRKVKQEIKNSISGTVTRMPVALGQQVAVAQTQLAEVADTNNLVINATISEFDISKLKVGQKASLDFTAISDKKFSGQVDFIYPAADVSQLDAGVNYTVQLRPEATDALQKQLKIGMSVDLEIAVAERQSAVSLPEEYIFSKDGKSYVKVYENSALQDKQVEIGFKGETAYEIKSGLTTADKVVLPTTEIREQRNSFSLFGN